MNSLRTIGGVLRLACLAEDYKRDVARVFKQYVAAAAEGVKPAK